MTVTAAPRSIQLARMLLVAVGMGHLVVPIVMAVNRSALAEIAAQQPDLGPAEIARSADIAVLVIVGLLWLPQSSRRFYRTT